MHQPMDLICKKIPGLLLEQLHHHGLDAFIQLEFMASGP
jgi:hypothetical protein